MRYPPIWNKSIDFTTIVRVIADFVLAEFVVRGEVIVGGMIAEEAVVVRALTIFDALELDLPRLLFFGVVNAFSSVGEIAGVDVVQDVELESPNDVGGVLDVP